MDQSPNISPAPDVGPTPQPEAVKQSSSAGPVIGIVIVIVLLALGALYFWGAQLNQTPQELPFILGDEVASEAWIPETSSSDEATDIQAEFDATDIVDFEQQMEADLDAIELQL